MVHRFQGLKGITMAECMKAKKAFYTSAGDAITLYSLRTEDGSGYRWLFGGSLRGRSVEGYYDELRQTGWYTSLGGAEAASPAEQKTATQALK